MSVMLQLWPVSGLGIRDQRHLVNECVAQFATGFVDDALRNTVPGVNEPLLQLVSAVFHFSCNVRNITKVRWQIMYAFNS